MTNYISILRGINVGGQKKIRMEELKALYEGLGFQEVTNYIQSGNIIFKILAISPSGLSEKIEKAIEEEYHFHVPVIIRTADEILKVLSSNPFLVEEEETDLGKLHVTFLEKEPLPAKVNAIENLNFFPDRFWVIGREVYLYCPGGYGNTKLSNNFFEKKLHQKATTRNWKTVGKLVELTSM
jgi:uncharacterized protein (DUF1697 family)